RPEPASLPPSPVELRQPSWAPATLSLPHGQGTPVPSPKQKGVPPFVSHSSGMPFAFWSWLVASAMSQVSGTELRLQSGAPAAIAHASPIWSPSQSACPGLAIVGQLSTQSTMLSASLSTSATPQPQAPGADFSGSFGHPSAQFGAPSPSSSKSTWRVPEG